MKKWLIEWETCFCEDFPERQGSYTVEAETEDEAAKSFDVFHAVISRISEVKEC